MWHCSLSSVSVFTSVSSSLTPSGASLQVTGQLSWIPGVCLYHHGPAMFPDQLDISGQTLPMPMCPLRVPFLGLWRVWKSKDIAYQMLQGEQCPWALGSLPLWLSKGELGPLRQPSCFPRLALFPRHVCLLKSTIFQDHLSLSALKNWEISGNNNNLGAPCTCGAALCLSSDMEY